MNIVVLSDMLYEERAALITVLQLYVLSNQSTTEDCNKCYIEHERGSDEVDVAYQQPRSGAEEGNIRWHQQEQKPQ